MLGWVSIDVLAEFRWTLMIHVIQEHYMYFILMLLGALFNNTDLIEIRALLEVQLSVYKSIHHLPVAEQ